MIRLITNLRLRTKLAGAFATLVLVMLLTAGLTSRVAQGVMEANDAVAGTHDVLSDINSVRLALSQIHTSYRSYLLYGDITYLASYNSSIEHYTEATRNLRSGTKGRPELQQEWDDLEAAVDEWRTSYLEPGIEVRRGVDEGAEPTDAGIRFLSERDASVPFREISRLLADRYDTEIGLLLEHQRAAQRAEERTKTMMIATPVIVVFTGLVLAVVMARDIATAVSRLGSQAERIAQGDYAARIVTTRADEIGQTATAFNHMADQLQEAISGQQRLAAEAEARAQRTATVVENLAEGLLQVKADGEVANSNRAAHRMFGAGEGRLDGQQFSHLVRTRSGNGSVIDLLPDAGSGAVTLLAEGIRLNRTVFPLEIAISAIQGEDGARHICILRDITERRTHERRLRQEVEAANSAESRTRAVLDAANEAIILFAADGTISALNNCFTEYFNLEPGDAIGHSASMFGDRLRRTIVESDRIRDMLNRGLTDTEYVATEYFTQRWPQHRDLEVYTRFIASVDGRPLGRLFALRDITHQREVERLKNEFVSHVSHELRTPLTSIIGYLDLILDEDAGAVNEMQREYLAIGRGNAQRLLTMVNGLLDISRIEAGKIDMHITEVDLVALAHRVKTSMQPQVNARKQELTLQAPENVPQVQADADRITQVLTNLVSNASKYTSEGGKIGIEIRKQDEAVAIDVRDTGIGMSEEELSNLFTSFYRADNRTTRSVAGAGLGLSITQSLVNSLGGTIDVRSTPGEGSIFTVTLPVA